MSLSTTLLLGFIAGVTIVLGLPVGRLRRPMPSMRLLLNAIAVGVLMFLFWDVVSAGWAPVESALGSVHAGHGGLGAAFGYGALFFAGLAVGLLALVWYERWMGRRMRMATVSGSPRPEGPGAMTMGEVRAPRGIASWSSARRLSLFIAVGIGLHNFGEGLAIGQSAATGEIGLALMLVIGFGLHNATEGFGVVAPLTADVDADGTPRRPSWPFLLGLGAIAGGPTFVGTIIGHGFTSEALTVVFLTLAAGSILYVVVQLVSVAAKARRADLLAYGLLIGLFAGFVTDGILVAAGS